MASQKPQAGRKGEDFTAELLVARGMRLHARNYLSRWGEIDIVASDSEYICFVEVKTRKQNSMVTGEESVTTAKQRRIIRTALCWLDAHNSPLQPRFDVCVVTTDRAGSIISHEYYDSAFDAEGY